MARTRLALLPKKERENWTGKHRNMARKIFWKDFFGVGWSDVSQCQACQMEEGTAKHRLCHCPEWLSVRRGLPEAFRKWEQKAKTSKKESKWQRGIVEQLFCGSYWKFSGTGKISG